MGRVSPFGHPRIKACSQLPTAFRSVPRPSSPLDTKASTKCSYLSASTSMPSRTEIKPKPGPNPYAQVSIKSDRSLTKKTFAFRSFTRKDLCVWNGTKDPKARTQAKKMPNVPRNKTQSPFRKTRFTMPKNRMPDDRCQMTNKKSD